MSPEVILESSWSVPGVILESFWSHSGIILESSWSHPEVILKSSWSHPGVILIVDGVYLLGFVVQKSNMVVVGGANQL